MIDDVNAAGRIATVAALIARGCPDHALDAAFDWLVGRKLPDTTAEMLAELDEAIRVATAYTRDD